MLQTLEEHNAGRLEAAKIQQEESKKRRRNGIACPACGEELLNCAVITGGGGYHVDMYCDACPFENRRKDTELWW